MPPRAAPARCSTAAPTCCPSATARRTVPQGFRFKFRDRIDGKPVFLYVAPETLQAYPHRRYLEDILGCAETVRYFTLYALNRLVEAPSGKSYSLEPDALRHLAIIPGPAKDDASQSSS